MVVREDGTSCPHHDVLNLDIPDRMNGIGKDIQHSWGSWKSREDYGALAGMHMENFQQYKDEAPAFAWLSLQADLRGRIAELWGTPHAP